MIRIDVQALTAAVYSRLRSDAAGATVRGLLGAGAASVIPAEGLSKETLPVQPFVALRGGPIPTVSDVIHAPTFTWWVYDDPQQRYYRINGLLLPIGRAFDFETNPLVATGVPISRVTVAVGGETPDPALGLVVRPVQLVIYC